MPSISALPFSYIMTAAAFLVSLVSGLIYIHFQSRNQSLPKEEGQALRKTAVDIMINCALTFIIVWKISPLFFSFSNVVANPSSLLFLPGGLPGSIIAAIASVGLLIWQLRRRAPRLAPGAGLLYRTIGLMLAAGLIFAISGFRLQKLSESASSITESQRNSTMEAAAPTFSLANTKGEQVKLEDFRGKPVVLFFWTTWCPSCKAALPEIHELQLQYKEEVQVLGINLTLSESSSGAVRRFAEQENPSFPILLETSGSVQSAYSIRNIPVTVIIDSDGNLVYRRTGAVTAGMLRRALRHYIP